MVFFETLVLILLLPLLGGVSMHSEKKFDSEKEKRKHIALLAFFFLVLIWSVINPHDYFSWLLLTIPPVIYVSVLIFTYKKLKFTTFTYFMVFIHVTILLIGSKYTYTLNPLFFELKELFSLSRNYYDRVGHIAQGFIPVFIVKEFLLRKYYFKRSKFFYLIVFSLVLAFSAFYELLEFAVVIISGKPANVIISPQGDPWDTHWDMVMALVGAALGLITFGRLHDKKMDEIE
jgi:putative membrane protein